MSWSAIVGHARVIKGFQAAWKGGRLGQAYLFIGTAGIGKRTLAEELAKAVLCLDHRGTLQACDRCRNCILAGAGTHPDILAAAPKEDKSELTIDVVRTLCDQLSLKPSQGNRKVAVVDGAEEMNEESANAFLKTLEEPPPGSLLILIGGATADRQLRTVRSRCQAVEFAELTPIELRAVLAKTEVPYPVDDLSIALAAGSVGRAIEFAEPKFRELLVKLTAEFQRPGADPFAWAETWITSLDDLGKGLPAHREISRNLLHGLIELLRRAWQSALGHADADLATAPHTAPMAARYGPGTLAELLERFQRTDGEIDRMAKLDYALEALALDAVTAG